MPDTKVDGSYAALAANGEADSASAPRPQTFHYETQSKFRWGVLGPGSIARKFATGLKALPGHELTAVASSVQDRADFFAKEFDVRKAYSDYRALVADSDVDAIYAARPHTFHAQDALLCIEAGKPVLVEKPFAVNAAEAKRVIDAARAANVFVMEAMWSRFFPLVDEMRRLIADGVIGEPRMIQADFGFRAGINPEGRLFNPSLAGGGLLDVGIYPLSFSSMIFGEPTQVTGIASIGETGVDEQNGIVLGHKGGQISLLASAVRTNTAQDALILGTDGRVRVHAPFWNPRAFTVSRGGKDELHERSVDGNGYEFEALEVEKRVRAGQTESELLPLDETLSLIRTMDKLRAQWGLKFPGEN